MMTKTVTRKVQITWVERGSENAACLGLDEVVEVTAEFGVDLLTATLQAQADAEYYGECQGIDLERYQVVADLLD